eukprot:TRINITY_DN57839_c0_g1_i1.p1 TRINITY_DN57839_c0_g1~~TRINITY_DN57839_c0_g1_i1.p1  ORF type:complete len:275 (+),score=67.34 TRINITY_DN57839_c0_g1_i1:54-878(+)
MFLGKKLKDLTEAEIRDYAEKVTLGEITFPQPGGLLEADASCEIGASGVTDGDIRDGSIEPVAAATCEPRDSIGSQGVNDASVAAESHLPHDLSEVTLEAAPTYGPANACDALAENSHREAEKVAAAELSEEERSRLQMLSQGCVSQMPAVRSEDGQLQKTVEHYAVSDSLEQVTISIQPEKDLFEGAGGFFNESCVEVVTREREVTIFLRGVPASSATSGTASSCMLADWRLHLSPLMKSVDPEGTTWRFRNGKLSVKLKKKKPQEWRKLLQF